MMFTIVNAASALAIKIPPQWFHLFDGHGVQSNQVDSQFCFFLFSFFLFSFVLISYYFVKEHTSLNPRYTNVARKMKCEQCKLCWWWNKTKSWPNINQLQKKCVLVARTHIIFNSFYSCIICVLYTNIFMKTKQKPMHAIISIHITYKTNNK